MVEQCPDILHTAQEVSIGQVHDYFTAPRLVDLLPNGHITQITAYLGSMAILSFHLGLPGTQICKLFKWEVGYAPVE